DTDEDGGVERRHDEEEDAAQLEPLEERQQSEDDEDFPPLPEGTHGGPCGALDGGLATDGVRQEVTEIPPARERVGEVRRREGGKQDPGGAARLAIEIG